MKYLLIFLSCLVSASHLSAQLKWENVDTLYHPLPPTVHVYRSVDPLDGKPNRAFYIEALLDDRSLDFMVDTTFQRRLTPAQFYARNPGALAVVNTTFFSFATHQNLSPVIMNSRQAGFNIHSVPGRGKDTFTYRHPLGSAIGITKNRTADIAWVFGDSSQKFAYVIQQPLTPVKDSVQKVTLQHLRGYYENNTPKPVFKKWKVQVAVGGGPVLIQNAQVQISNNEELKFAGKAIDDKHPRTTMGYTANGRIIILVIEGRNPGIAEGASLVQAAQILKDLGCEEALNLDGGGSSCMLVNGKETIRVSDAGGQRPVPAVFIIKNRVPN